MTRDEMEYLNDFPLVADKYPNSKNNGWIKCSEKMPDDCNDVTLYSLSHGVFNGYYWRSENGFGDVGFYSNSGEHEDGLKHHVTHCQPLPLPPED